MLSGVKCQYMPSVNRYTVDCYSNVVIVYCACSVREWIQCMQVCCQSRTSYSSQLLPPHQQSTTAAFRLPSFHYPLDSAAYLTQPILNVHSPWHTGPSACDYLSSTAVVAPSTLASSLVVAPSSHPSSVLVDTGYVSADSSPTAHAPLVS